MESYYTDNQTYPAASTGAYPTVTIATGDTVRASQFNSFQWWLNATGTAYCVAGFNSKGTHAGSTSRTAVASSLLAP